MGKTRGSCRGCEGRDARSVALADCRGSTSMKRSTNRILTTHVGSLPRPSDLVELYRDNAPDDGLLPRLRSAIAEIVHRQVESGIDVVNDGEFGKAMRSAVDFGAWWSYVYARLAGFELRQEQVKKGRGGVDVRQQGTPRVRRILRRGGSAGQGGPAAGRVPPKAAPAPHACMASPAPRQSKMLAKPQFSATSRIWLPRLVTHALKRHS